MSVTLWLIGRELRARWRRVALAAAVVASLAGAATAIELLARAREDAVAARVDEMGPALTVVPAGTTEGALARAELGERALPLGTAERVAGALGPDLRRTEARLVLTREIGGVRTPVIGLERWPAGAPDGLLVGAELASRLGRSGAIAIAGEAVDIAGVLPGTGEIEDVALVLPLARAVALRSAPGSLNELRVYLRAGVDAEAAARRLGDSIAGVAVVRHDRGSVAATELPRSLARHRVLTYALFAVAAALCLLIASHLDTAERRIEVATLVAIGARRSTIVGALVGRSVAVAALGAMVGVGLGFGLAAAQDLSVAGALALHPGALAGPIASACVLAALAGAPSALVAASRDPVSALQDT